MMRAPSFFVGCPEAIPYVEGVEIFFATGRPEAVPYAETVQIFFCNGMSGGHPLRGGCGDRENGRMKVSAPA